MNDAGAGVGGGGDGRFSSEWRWSGEGDDIPVDLSEDVSRRAADLHPDQAFETKTRALLDSMDTIQDDAGINAAYLDQDERDGQTLDNQEVSGYGGSIPENVAITSASVHILASGILEIIQAIMAARDIKPARA